MYCDVVFVKLLILGVDMCKILTTYKGNIKQHLVKEGSNYFCSLCEFTSYKGQCVLNHIDAKHSSETYECHICQRKGINSLAALRNHHDRIHLGKFKSKSGKRKSSQSDNAKI